MFLDKKQACLEYQSSNYVKQMKPGEIQVRTKNQIPLSSVDIMRDSMINNYCNSVDDFSEDEKRCLNWFVSYVEFMMNQSYQKLKPSVWKFIKLRHQLDWELPYTLNDCIVIPEKMIVGMMKAHATNNTDMVTYYANTITHEAVHLHQKRNPQFYNSMFKQFWGFQQVHPDKIKFKKEYLRNWITNPDGMKVEWIFSVKKNNNVEWYVPLLTIDSNDSTKHAGVLVQLKEVMDKTGRSVFLTVGHTNIANIPEYVRKFYGHDVQLYHPNEISAHILADYVIKKKMNIDNTGDSYRFYHYVSGYLQN